ncbi:MAG: hypothetical protein LBT18_03275 [Endomicrobium sp.]|jgi:uncharacterized protein YacL|nr:hypothetical protein [Endomicrobium sp.]
MFITIVLSILLILVIILIKIKKSIYEKAIIDADVLMDGRIYDIVKTKFLSVDLIIPSFVIAELKNFSKSTDPIKRNRSKRGLLIIEKLQKSGIINAKILKVDFKKINDPILKIVKLAKTTKSKIITKNFNLYKEASFSGITVLNMNDLEIALYPVFLPGEQVYVHLIKEGSQSHQAIGYFDDKTMIVAENGRSFIGKDVVLTITSSMFTLSGKIIFGKVKEQIK